MGIELGYGCEIRYSADADGWYVHDRADGRSSPIYRTTEDASAAWRRARKCVGLMIPPKGDRMEAGEALLTDDPCRIVEWKDGD
jgi:hypothetical protein